MHLVLLNEIPEDANLRQEWNGLVSHVPQPQVFYTYEWALAVNRAYKKTLPALLFLGYEGDRLCGIVALASRPLSREASFLCATTADYCDFIAPLEHSQEFISLVLAELKTQGFTSITLANLPGDSNSAVEIRGAAKESGYHLFARTGYLCAQVALDRIEREQDKPVFGRARKIRRSLNSMSREAPLRLDHERSWDAIEPVLQEFVEAHVARFLATGRISNLARNERRAFLYELAKLLSQCGWLTLTRLLRGETAVAWNYGFQFEHTWFWYQPTFRTEMEKYSPGLCLLAKIVEEAAAAPAMTTVDLGLGAEEYKEVFANQSRRTLYITLRASPAQHAREIVRYSAARSVKAYPRIENWVRTALAAWQRAGDRAHRDGMISILRWLGRRVRDFFWSRTEVFFFSRGNVLRTKPSAARLLHLDLKVLAAAAAQYADDQSTCTYLLRTARLARQNDTDGFALIDGAGKFLHFAWIAPFDGFYLSELNHRVHAPSTDCIMLFDCWTPPAFRGNGHYGAAVALIADSLLERGKRPWIFSAATNTASVRGLEKAGFQRRYSLITQRLFGWQTTVRQELKVNETIDEEVSAHS